MKKLRNLLEKNFHYLCIVSVIAFGFITIVGSGGGGGGGSDPVPTPDPVPTSCDGPVPCLTTDWGDVGRQFEETDGSPIVVLSDGTIFAGAGINDDLHLMSLGGTPIDCYNGEIELAAIDLNDNFIDEFEANEWFVASGNAKICDRTLTVTNLVVDGVLEDDVVATYVGTIAASVHDTSEIPPEILYDTLDKLREDW